MLQPVMNFTDLMGISSCSAAINSASLILISFNAASTVLSNSQIVLTVTVLNSPRSAYIAYPLGISTYYKTSLNSRLDYYNSSLTTLT